MTAGLLLFLGTLVAATGMTVAVGTVAVSRVELYRWIANRLSRTGTAIAVLAVPARMLGTANAIAALGSIVAAFGVTALVATFPAWLAILTLLLVAIPGLLAAAYALPRALGQRWAEPIVKSAIPWLDRVALPFAPLMPSSGEMRPRAALAALLESDQEALDTQELLSVLLGVLSFTERPVREIITPRTEIVAVREGARLDEVGQIFAESGYSRIPVYHDSLDNIVGMIYALDLLKVEPGAELPIRPVTVAPASKRCADLLFEMQRERRQFAVVLDEYGGTAGIATFQDLLEELVEEISAEPEPRPSPGPGGVEVFEATGTTPCDELAARFDLTLPPQAETVGGMLARAAGRIPQAGERYLMAGLEFDVLAATPTRVDRVVVRRGPVAVVPLEGTQQ